MKRIFVLIAMLAFAKAAFSQTYLGVGVGTSSGDQWNGSSPELSLGRLYSSGLLWETGYCDLGSRDRWDNVGVAGVTIEAGYSTNLVAGKGYVNFGGGVFLYSSDYATGDASYSSIINAAPILSLSAGYNLKSNLSVRLKYGKYILKDNFGSPNRITAELVFNL